MSLREIRACYDNDGVWVYQAYKPEIVAAALEKGTFSTGFNLERMTWIKPSFGWMLYRSGFASKHRQTAILKIKVCHEGFQEILGLAEMTSYDRARFESEDAWQRALKHSKVRVQWDPDRTLRLHKLERRAIQIGVRGEVVRRYVNEWILDMVEVTKLAVACGEAAKRQVEAPPVPEERVYTVDASIRARLRMDLPEAEQVHA